MKKRFVNNFKDKLLRFVHKSIYKPGHYYSAVPNPKDIQFRKEKIFNSIPNLKGIKINESEQIEFLQNNTKNLNKFLYKESLTNQKFRYHFPNNMFGKGDALSLFLIIENFRPKRIIEIGSGFSSSVMLDLNEHLYNNKINLDFIEPYPERLNSLIKVKDRKTCNVHVNFVQDIPIDFFQSLRANDILFIDSSHVSKIGSDVNYLFFDVIPNLKKGVIIHIHDVMYPFEYPEEFIDYGIYWNEAYFLRSFLSFNGAFEIILWNDFLFKENHEEIKTIDPLFSAIGGGSIWIKKLVD
jgi:hypothetical protein